jgi:hypothetical protein
LEALTDEMGIPEPERQRENRMEQRADIIDSVACSLVFILPVEHELVGKNDIAKLGSERDVFIERLGRIFSKYLDFGFASLCF